MSSRWYAPCRIKRRNDDDITAFGEVRFFSVDGGHTEETTANDLFLAEKSIIDRGVVALDDAMNTQWTGAIGGLARYKNQGEKLVGFALVPNKLFLCRPEHAAEYRAMLREEYRLNLDQADAEMIGDEIDNHGALPEHLLVPAKHRADVEEIAALHHELEELRFSRRYRTKTVLAEAYNRLLLR